MYIIAGEISEGWNVRLENIMRSDREERHLQGEALFASAGEHQGDGLGVDPDEFRPKCLPRGTVDHRGPRGLLRLDEFHARLAHSLKKVGSIDLSPKISSYFNNVCDA